MPSSRAPGPPERVGGVLLLTALLSSSLLGAGGCKEPREAAAPDVVSARHTREPIDVMAPGGERTLRLEVEPGGYNLKDRAGWSIGRAIMGDSSVRVTDRTGTTLITVARTAAGFTLDDGSGTPLLGTLGDDGIELTRGGERLGLLTEHTLELPDRTLFVIDNGAYIQVAREDQALLEVRGPVGDGAAFLAWTELSFPERLSLMLFFSELA